MNKNVRIALAALVAAGLFAGCLLVSGQITIVQEFDDDSGAAASQVYYLSVDLNENDDYADHKDKIKSLEAFGFVVKITNGGNIAARGEGYLSLSPITPLPTDRDDILAAKIPRIFYVSDPIDPGEFRNITFEMSQDYIENFDDIDEAIKDGEIYLYGVTDQNTLVKYEDFKLIATINVEI